MKGECSIEKTLRTLLSISLAVIMLCVSLGGASTASAETATEPQTINVMILYDESYVYKMKTYSGITTTEQLAESPQPSSLKTGFWRWQECSRLRTCQL